MSHGNIHLRTVDLLFKDLGLKVPLYMISNMKSRPHSYEGVKNLFEYAPYVPMTKIF